MATRSVLRMNLLSSLRKSFVNSGINCMQRRIMSSGSYTSSGFGRSHRFTAVLAGSCGITMAASGVLWYRTYFNDVKARPIRVSASELETILDQEVPKLSVTLYQYQNCPFCGKVRAFLDYYGVDYSIVEVNPLWKKEISFSKYKKVPFVIANDKQVRTSFLQWSLISFSRTKFLYISYLFKIKLGSNQVDWCTCGTSVIMSLGTPSPFSVKLALSSTDL